MSDSIRIAAAQADGYEARAGRTVHLAKIANAVAVREHAADAPDRSASGKSNGVIRIPGHSAHADVGRGAL